MANTKQAKKRARQGESRRQHNASQRSNMRTCIKRMLKIISEGKFSKALEEFRATTSVIDKMVSRGQIHKNKAARHKSRLCAHIRKLEASSK